VNYVWLAPYTFTGLLCTAGQHAEKIARAIDTTKS